ncbi:YjfB family protein [Sediminibacillus massiliensis]|uniref:YjfB family protein n=1 Tax=Sediminibacillus massiliensis TaxID=1926277 RepID=UPI0009884B6E|nr:YjfB family protein [Sediminibacillus massiliensis]
MDIAALSMALSQSSVRQDANLSLMNKVMDQAEHKSQGMIDMMQHSSVKAMQQAAQPHLGASIDIKG